MRVLAHHRAQRAIERVFVEGPGSAPISAVLRHVAACPQCAAFYSRMATAEAALAANAQSRLNLTVERVGAALGERLAQTALPRRMPRWVLPGLVPLAAVASLALWAIWPSQLRLERIAIAPGTVLQQVAIKSEMAARGHVDANASVGVRLFRVVSSNSAQPAAAVRLADTVTFTYTATDPSLPYLALFGIQEAHVRWYYPGYDGHQSIRIGTGVVDAPLGDGIVLSVNHAEGPLRLVALFSSLPLRCSEIETAVVQSASVAALVDALHDVTASAIIAHTLVVDVSGARAP
jgi:hypothetical protein